MSDLQKRLDAIRKGAGENNSGNTQVVQTYTGTEEGAVNLLEALLEGHKWDIHAKAMEGQGKLTGTDTMIVPVAGKAPKGSPAGNFTFYYTGKLVVAGSCPLNPADHGFVAA